MSRDKSGYQRFKHPWAVALSTALQRWLREHGYEGYVQFAKEVGLSREDIGDICRADRITMNTETYARIFLRTGLPEADPRSVPPRPSKGGGAINRSFTEAQWQKWKSSQGPVMEEAPAKASESEEDVSQTEPSQQKEPVPASSNSQPETQAAAPTIGSLLDGFIAILGRQMGQPVMAQVVESQKSVETTILAAVSLLQQKITPLEERISQMERQLRGSGQPVALEEQGIEPLAQALTHLLEKYFAEGATPQTRDQMPENERKILGKLAPQARIMSSTPDQREKSVGYFLMNQS